MRARSVAACAGLLLFVTFTLAACGGRPVALPDGDYLYACSDGENGYVFSLQNPGKRLVLAVTTSGLSWIPWGTRERVGLHDPRFLILGPLSFFDMFTLSHVEFPSQLASSIFTILADPDRLYVFNRDDLSGEYLAWVINRQGDVVEDLGSLVGNRPSPGFEWVLGKQPSEDPEENYKPFWVQRLRGGTPKRVDLFCPNVLWLWSGYDPFWHPDGEHLFYVNLNFSHSDHVVFYRCNVENEEEEHLLTVDTDAPVDRYRFSLDLRRMAFVTLPYGELDGLHAVDLGTGEVVKMHEGRSYHGFAWTRDGRYLVVEVDDGSPAGEGPRKLISFPEGTSYQLTKRYPCWFIHACPAPYTMDDLGSLAP